MLENLYEKRIDSTRSDNYYSGFDCCFGEITFCLTSGETGDTIKEYIVRFDEESGEIDQDVEYNTEFDGGYCVYSRLPKNLRAHIEAIVEAYKIEENDQYQATIEDFEEGYNPLGNFKSDNDNKEGYIMKDANKLLDNIVDSLISEKDKIIASVSINGIEAYLMQCELFSVYWAVTTSNGITQIFDSLENANIFYKEIKAHLMDMK